MENIDLKTDSKKKRKRRRRWIGRVLLVIALVLVILAINPVRTILSLRRVDGYPLYTMHWQGGYQGLMGGWRWLYPRIFTGGGGSGGDACAIFAALGEPDHSLLGRGFDWGYSPALLLFINPPGGYASVSMVDLTHLGLAGEPEEGLSVWQKMRMLAGPLFPLDGMNECGLIVAVATLAGSSDKHEDDKSFIHCLAAVRWILDHCRTVAEALTWLGGVDIGFTPVVGLHLMLADPTGNAAVVEWIDGEPCVIRNEQPWQAATNFALAKIKDPDEVTCSRYRLILAALEKRQGKLTVAQALDILKQVADKTPWSVVYDMDAREMHLVMNRQFDRVYRFDLKGGRMVGE